MYLDLIKPDPVNNVLMKYASGKVIFMFDKETEALALQVWILHHKTASLLTKEQYKPSNAAAHICTYQDSYRKERPSSNVQPRTSSLCCSSVPRAAVSFLEVLGAATRELEKLLHWEKRVLKSKKPLLGRILVHYTAVTTFLSSAESHIGAWYISEGPRAV